MLYSGSITDVRGILVGNSSDLNAMTGCTTVLSVKGAVAGVDVRGSAPGSRETELLRPCNLVEKIHAVVLAGGSAYGLDASGGVMHYLEENGYGLDTKAALVPIVSSAVLFDLAIGSSDIRPDFKMGYESAANASKEFKVGNVGAGCGATIGKHLGYEHAMKGGLGTASIKIEVGQETFHVGALVAVNSYGDIYEESKKIAGAYDQKNQALFKDDDLYKSVFGNTTIAVIATDMSLSKDGANKVASMAQNGLARSVRPAHTMFDGDTVFVLSTSCDHLLEIDENIKISMIGEKAAKALEFAVINAVKSASSYKTCLAYRDL